MTGPSYDLLVVLHALSAVVGFGAVGVTGTYAARARSVREPRKDARLVRYFHPGTNWAERSLLVTPVLGGIVLSLGDSAAASQPWPWIGLGCWVVAAGFATGLCWPAERRIQAWLASTTAEPTAAEPTAAEPATAELSAFHRACRAVQWGASATSVCFLVAVVVMIWQPG